MTGRPRAAIANLPAYKPGKSAEQTASEHNLDEAIKLASNETSYGPLPSVLAAVSDGAGLLNRYPDHRGLEVRSALATKLNVETSQITLGCGSVGLLQQLFLAYIDPGDEVVYPWRSFEVHPLFSAISQAVAIAVPLVDEAFDLDAVSSAITSKTKLVILSTPNNPTGTVCSTSELKRFLESVPRDVVVVIDEAYLEFVTASDVEDPVDAILPFYPNVVVFRTFSKAYGLANLRVGYAVGNSEIISALDKVALPFLVNGLAQAAVLASLQPDASAELKLRVDEVVRERTRVTDLLTNAGWPVTPSQANFVWLPIKTQAGPLFQALEAKGIVTRPFEGEGLRITIGTPEENNQLVNAIGTC